MWSCGLCSEVFGSEGVLDHLRELHCGQLELDTFLCGVCPFRSSTFDALANHLLKLGHTANAASRRPDQDAVKALFHALAQVQASLAPIRNAPALPTEPNSPISATEPVFQHNTILDNSQETFPSFIEEDGDGEFSILFPVT